MAKLELDGRRRGLGMLCFDLGKKGGSSSKCAAGLSQVVSAAEAAESPEESTAQGRGVLGSRRQKNITERKGSWCQCWVGE